MAHLHLNELSLICDMWLNKITYLLTYLLTGNPGFEIVPQYQSSKITVFVWDKNMILKFLGNTK